MLNSDISDIHDSVSHLPNTTCAAPVLPIAHEKGGKDGKEEVLQVSNTEFVTAVFSNLPDRAFAALCTKSGDPTKGGWIAMRSSDAIDSLKTSNNNFVTCSSFYPSADGSFNAKKSNFAACHFLMLDDLGTKVELERLGGIELSWLIETSPGNFQGGVVFSEPVTDGDLAQRLLNALIENGLCDPGASGPLNRWARLPVAINGKPKYITSQGMPFECRLIQWRPNARYSPHEIIDQLGLKFAVIGNPKKSNRVSEQTLDLSSEVVDDTDQVLIPKASENPVVVALKDRGFYKTPLGGGKHDITCPWVHEHTDSVDSGAAYFEPDASYPIGGFCCQHSHRNKYNVRALLDYLGVRTDQARHKSVIRIVTGEMDRVVDAAEKELANLGHYYQSGGLIVTIATDPTTKDLAIVPITLPELTRELSVAATWESYRPRNKSWVQSDPPPRHASILYESKQFRHLSPLIGLARQPYFRESDGELITQPGYDERSQRYGVFDARQFVIEEPTIACARNSLAKLEDLLTEFAFVSSTDRAAALSAMFTAVVRPTLDYAPAFHVLAPVFGSGKTYLCELIGAFAGPGSNAKVSYPRTSEEATKVMLAMLLAGPAVVEFDDMDTDWLAHGTIKRMLTSPYITDRILGVSKTATVSTRTLFLGSGNNVGPVRDLLRRVLTIHLDPRCATPATLTYRGFPVEKVRQRRGEYVSAVLNIIQAWRKAGMPRSGVQSIATFGGAWTDYCRYPLMWLGHPDPATSLLEQVRHDPEADALAGLMSAWFDVFGQKLTTVRRALDDAYVGSELREAMFELPIYERGEINPSKLGWLLKKNANRIIGAFEIQKGAADGRIGWRVVPVKTPPLPVSPPSYCATGKS